MRTETAEKLDEHGKTCGGRDFDFHSTEVFNTKKSVKIASYVCRKCMVEVTEHTEMNAKVAA